MGFHSPRYRGGRRRRVLLDEARWDGRPWTAAPRATQKRRYTPDALSYAQPVITDYLPERKRTLLLAMQVSLLASGAAIALDAWLRLVPSQVPSDTMAFLNASSAGSLAHLVAAAQFLLAAFLSVLIYAIRRRKLDDFHGTYRFWMVSAGILGSFAVFSLVPVLPLVSVGLSAIPRMPRVNDPLIFGRILMGSLAGLLLMRWLVEMRRCRLAQTCLVASGIFASAACLDLVKLLSLSSYAVGVIAAHTLYFLAIHCGLTALLLYGRHVRLDAQGLLGKKKRKTSRRKTPRRVAEDVELVEEAYLDGEDDEIEEASPPSSSLLGSLLPSAVSQAERDEIEELAEEGIDFRELSKAERKRLRRQRRA